MTRWQPQAERRMVAPLRLRRPGSFLIALMCCLGAACGDAEPVPDRSTPGVVHLRPGDSLLERLESARLPSIPAHNLPADVASLLGDDVRVEAPVPALAWQRVEAMPPEWSSALAGQGRGHLWWARSPILLVEGAPEPVVRVRGEPVSRWEFGDVAPMPDDFAGWFRGQRMVLAVSEQVPQQVSLVGTVSAVSEFGRMERGRALHGQDPVPAGLVTRIALGDVKRSALLVPAPGVVEFAPVRLVADRLHVAVGVAADAWVLIDGVVQRRRKVSDGVRFAVEVVVHDEGGVASSGMSGAGRPQRIWSGVVSAAEVGMGWVEAEVDLSRWRDEVIALRLVTEPATAVGAAGDAVHDYALWADLRLRGGAVLEPRRPNVVLIDIDTLRADRMAAYGAQRETTPGLDAWASERAVTYTDSVSAAPWTLPSTVSFLTGLAVHQHGVDDASDALGRGAATLASILASAGYETRAIAGGGYLRPDYGCDAGFERYETRDAKDLDWTSALDFVRTRDSERPFFLFLHTYSVHAPYAFDERWADPGYDGVLRRIEVDTGTVFEPWHRGELDLGEEDGRYIEALYDGLVSQMDREVAGFLRSLRGLVPEGELMVVLTSDHGEAFLEHGHLGHGVSLYDEQLRVPLIVEYPDGLTGTSDVPASGVDLLPTVLQAVGLAVPDGLAGRSLREVSGDAVRVAQSGEDLRAALSGGFKLIENRADPGAGELYELTSDAGELVDLSAQDTARVEALRRRLEWFLGAHPTPEGGHAVDNTAGRAVLEELRALGYLGGGDDEH
jgi:arylsulfatase A-like enzyme